MAPSGYQSQGPQPKLFATSLKPQATSCDNLSLDISMNPIYSYNRAARELVSKILCKSTLGSLRGEAGSSSLTKWRIHERQENKTRIPSWRRKARRDPEEGNQIPTGPNHGDSGSSPRVYHPGPEVHRDRVSRHSKSGNQRNGSRRLELTLRAPSRGLASFPMQPASSNQSQASSVKLQATSRKLQAFKIVVNQI